MSTTYTGDPASNPTSITIPSDGDGPGIKAADVNVAFEALADQIAHMRDRFTPLITLAPFWPRTKTASGFSQSPSVANWFSSDGASPLNIRPWIWSGSDEAYFDPSGVQVQDVYTLSSASYISMINLGPEVLVDGSTLTELRLYTDPAGSHTQLPEVMPALYVLRSTRTRTISALRSSSPWSVDSAANVAAYEAAHDLVYTPDQNNTIDHSTYVYTLLYQHEGGAHALVGGYIGSIRCTHTRNNP